MLAVEVKYQGRITSENGRYLLKQVGGGIVLSRDTLDLKSGDLLLIPTALFLGVDREITHGDIEMIKQGLNHPSDRVRKLAKKLYDRARNSNLGN